MPPESTRIEHDLLGDKAVPAAAYYGVQTARALENFHISGVELRLYPEPHQGVRHGEAGGGARQLRLRRVQPEILTGIEGACQELIDGKLHDEFRLDVFQGGAGTSTNMNANEVIANRALELMGHKKGEYQFCDPHDHVNGSQSTNDAYPTSLHVGMALGNLRAGRGHQGADRRLPRQGQGVRADREDGPHAASGRRADDARPGVRGLCRDAGGRGPGARAIERVLCEINMGGTAIGTGLNAPAATREKCTAHLATITGLPIHLATNLIEATQDTQAFVLYSSCMKSLAIKLSKVCNDLRLLSSGPRCGFREINLPPKQPGSSIMPGKVNPVIPEVVNMVCFRVIGSDLTVTMAAEAGQLQLNVFEPVIAACIFEAQTLFINAARTLRVHCVDGITANADVCRHYVEYSIGTVTALNPVIGYEHATELAAEAMKTGRGIMELVREKKVLTEEQIAKVLDPAAMTGQGRPVMTRRAAGEAARGAARGDRRRCVLARSGSRRRRTGSRPTPGACSRCSPPRSSRSSSSAFPILTASVLALAAAVLTGTSRRPRPTRVSPTPRSC